MRSFIDDGYPPGVDVVTNLKVVRFPDVQMLVVWNNIENIIRSSIVESYT